MRMIERRVGAHAHEFLRADLDDGNSGIVMEVRDNIIGHRIHLEWRRRRTQSNSRANSRGNFECRAPYWRVQLMASSANPRVRTAPRSFAHANSTQSCRPREALLSSGLLCRKNGTLSFSCSGWWETTVFEMKRRRLGLALVATVVSAAVLAALWPQAREAGSILSAQDDPAALTDAQLNSALQNNQAVVAQRHSIKKRACRIVSPPVN